MTAGQLLVIGLGADGSAGLSAESRDHIAAARILAGGRRHLDLFPDWRGDRIVLEGNLEACLAHLRERYRREKTVVLASGDPLFYGIGRLLLRFFPREDLLFVPHLTSVQLAFARVKETWHDARVVSVHGRPLETLLPALDAREPKVAVLTDARNHPAAIAALLRAKGIASEYTMWVCEDLGRAGEDVTQHKPSEMREETFSSLNVVLLLRQQEEFAMPPLSQELPLLGIPENALQHRPGPRGLITQREIQLLALCALELRPNDVFWDVGAASGSVALEAARLSPRLQVFAVERNRDELDRLEANVARYGAGIVHVVAGEAPAALTELPDPNAVFVGGSGGRLREILEVVGQRVRTGGRIVVDCVTVETFAAGWEWLQGQGLSPEATQVQLSHTRSLGRLHCLEPEKPIFILRARKP
jgi:precorrin-6Y C5,15-methyltransferase (decarboxylating)